jgi:hypothetical protein
MYDGIGKLTEELRRSLELATQILDGDQRDPLIKPLDRNRAIFWGAVAGIAATAYLGRVKPEWFHAAIIFALSGGCMLSMLRSQQNDQFKDKDSDKPGPSDGG